MNFSKKTKLKKFHLIVLSKKQLKRLYTFKDFITNLKQHKELELHDNILEILGATRKQPKEIMLVLEYADDGTLCQYLEQKATTINWKKRICLAKQLVSAVKFLHENNIIHMNLHSENVLVHKGDIKLNEFGTSRYQIYFSNIYKFIQYIDPQYLQSIETYKLNRSSDVYSIGILLWQISSGVVPFESESPYGYDLLNAIIHGKRENEIPGTPNEYVKIYEECWQHNPDQRPSIQRVFEDLNILDSSNDMMENSDSQIPDDRLEMGNLSVANLLQHYTDLYNEKTKELELISSVIATFQKTS
ncbi:kinase-like domain-containing protein [Gigaspora rosea]|uniref:Kinase-like domain-containing protein n=1 Tax=Gigaspora rosea TaxID=44941 RepID=A0A397W654_9GLOM|nr:kinase-like domain-containing protein [Gigaspora rosea]